MVKKTKRPGESRHKLLPPPAIKADDKCPNCGGDRTYLDRRRIVFREGMNRVVGRGSTEMAYTCLDCWAVWR